MNIETLCHGVELALRIAKKNIETVPPKPDDVDAGSKILLAVCLLPVTLCLESQLTAFHESAKFSVLEQNDTALALYVRAAEVSRIVEFSEDYGVTKKKGSLWGMPQLCNNLTLPHSR